MKTIEDFLAILQDKTLNFVHAHKVEFEGNSCCYAVLGNIPLDLGLMRITLQIAPYEGIKKHTTKIDLYDTNQINKLCTFLYEKDIIHSPVSFEADLIKLSELIQNYREALYEKETLVEHLPPLDIRVEKDAIQFLKDKNLIDNLDKQLANLGIVGDATNRLLTFLIAISYKTNYPLHGIIQSTSGAGKSHMINSIASCIPHTDLISLTRITSKSLYHYKEGHLMHKLILIQDFSGLDQESQYAFRELQSAGKISSSTSRKDHFGGIQSSVKTVHAHFSSLSATTMDIYTDNLSRSLLIKIDESPEQTLKIIDYQNALLSGKLTSLPKELAIQKLFSVIRVLQPFNVLNPYAHKLKIPLEAQQQRRLNQQFQYFILLVTWFHQHQREKTKDNVLLTTKVDILLAIDLLFDSIMLKIDDLDTSIRQFFERLKNYIVNKQPQAYESYRFTQKEIREALNLSKSYTGKCIKTLIDLEYVSIVSGTVNKGYFYKVACWQDDEKFRGKIKSEMYSQVERIKF